MRRVIVAVAIVSFLGCALAACGGRAAPARLSSNGGVDDTNADAASKVSVWISAPGQAFLTVPDKPASGCRWSVKLPVGIRLVSSLYDWPSTTPERKDTRTFTFAVAQPGMYVIKGVYARPGRKKPARTFAFSVYGNPAGWPVPGLVFSTLANGVGTDVGSMFAIVLEENPSTGYAWVMHFGPGLKLLRELTVTPSASSMPLVGAAGQHLWLFRVDKTGTMAVTGSYVRSWSPAVPATRFSLTVRTAPAGS